MEKGWSLIPVKPTTGQGEHNGQLPRPGDSGSVLHSVPTVAFFVARVSAYRSCITGVAPMKHVFLALALFGATSLAQADVTIYEPWVRGTVASQRATGAFMQLQADRDTRLLSASSPVAGVTEIHEMAMQDNVMKMRRVDGGIALAKGKTLELKPGSYHVMLMELKQPLKAGEQVPLTLTFEDGAKGKTYTREVKATVRSLAPQGAAPAGGHSHGAMMQH